MNVQPISYMQTDSRWATQRYKCNGGTMSIGGGGCGPTSAAMLISTITGKTILPTTTMKWACDKGYVYANQGTSYSPKDYFVSQFAEYGIKCERIKETCLSAASSVRPQVLSDLKQGYYFIALMKKGLWTSAGHFIVVWWADDKIRINDPASTKTERLNGDPDTFFSQAKYFWRVDAREFNKKAVETMKYYVKNNVNIVEVPVSQFKITMVNGLKKSLGKTNYCNANFFSVYHEDNGKTGFTLPVGHVVCDYEIDPSKDASSKWCDHYCHERGTFNNSKFTFDSSTFSYMNQFYGKPLTTLWVSNGKATINDITKVPEGLDYAITGIPIMKNGNDVKWLSYVKPQGWYGSELYATSHIFVGIKNAPADTIYVMGWTSKTSNMISSAEAYKVFKALGMTDVIKLDGGGSYYLNASGTTKATTENRRINCIIEFGPAATALKCPYLEPTVTLKKGVKNTSGVKWLQWHLNQKGFPCSIDGSFGPATDALVRQYQRAHSLAVDGSVGPATRKSLKEGLS